MSEHALAVLRGWYPYCLAVLRAWLPSWEAQMRNWNISTYVLYSAFLLAALATINSLRSRR